MTEKELKHYVQNNLGDGGFIEKSEGYCLIGEFNGPVRHVYGFGRTWAQAYESVFKKNLN